MDKPLGGSKRALAWAQGPRAGLRVQQAEEDLTNRAEARIQLQGERDSLFIHFPFRYERSAKIFSVLKLWGSWTLSGPQNMGERLVFDVLVRGLGGNVNRQLIFISLLCYFELSFRAKEGRVDKLSLLSCSSRVILSLSLRLLESGYLNTVEC